MQERSRRTVDAILTSAARIFGERGYIATTTNDVAEAAGVSIGSLYQYFPNKDSLLVALEERHLDDARAELTAVIGEWRRNRPDAATWARSLVETLVAINDTATHVVIYDAAPQLPRLEQLTAEVVDRLATAVAVHLRRWGQRARADLRAKVVVVAALRLVHDLAIRTPPGPERRRVCDEISSVIASAACTSSVVDARCRVLEVTGSRRV